MTARTGCTILVIAAMVTGIAAVAGSRLDPETDLGARGDDVADLPAGVMEPRLVTAETVADAEPVASDVELPPVVPVTERRAAELALFAAGPWRGYPDPRPLAWSALRDEAQQELLARGAAAFDELFEVGLHAQGFERDAATEALLRMGTNAVPGALRLLRDADTETRRAAMSLLSDLGNQAGGLGSQGDAVTSAVLAATGDDDAGIAESAEDFLGCTPACLPLIADELARGTLEQRLSALRIAGELTYETGGDVARSLLESAARAQQQGDAVRGAAAYWLARCCDLDEPVDSFPQIAGVPEVRLWALALAFDEDAPRDDVVAAIASSRDALTALLFESACHGRESDQIGDAVGYLRTLAADPGPLLLDVVSTTDTSSGRESALYAVSELAEENALGPHAARARDAGFAALTDSDEDVRTAAGCALASIHAAGTDVVPGLLRLLDARTDARSAVLSAIEGLGAAGAPALDRLRGLVLDSDEVTEVRTRALAVLAVVAPADAVAIERASLHDACRDVRCAAAELLLGEARDSDENLAEALACLDHPDERVRCTAAAFFARMKTPSEELAVVLLPHLADTSAGVRAPLAAFLLRADPPSPKAVEIVLACLRDADPEMRLIGVRANDALAACPDRAAPLLIPMLSDSDESVVAAAARALGRLDAEARATVPALSAALFNPQGRIRGAVALALGSIGKDAVSARPLLVACFRRRMESMTGELTLALDDLEWTPSPEDIEALVEMTPDRYLCGDVGWAARSLIARTGVAAAPAVSRLVAFARGTTHNTTGSFIEAISRVSAGEPETIAFLVEALKGDDQSSTCGGAWNVPSDAAEALGRIGPPARDAVPALVEALSYRESAVRREAARALLAITGKEPDLPKLPADWE